MFAGNAARGHAMNTLFNERWATIFGEMRQPVFDALAIVFQDWLNTLLETVAYDDLFVIEDVLGEERIGVHGGSTHHDVNLGDRPNHGHMHSWNEGNGLGHVTFPNNGDIHSNSNKRPNTGSNSFVNNYPVVGGSEISVSSRPVLENVGIHAASAYTLNHDINIIDNSRPGDKHPAAIHETSGIKTGFAYDDRSHTSTNDISIIANTRPTTVEIRPAVGGSGISISNRPVLGNFGVNTGSAHESYTSTHNIGIIGNKRPVTGSFVDIRPAVGSSGISISNRPVLGNFGINTNPTHEGYTFVGFIDERRFRET